jgi:hypothetical protein
MEIASKSNHISTTLILGGPTAVARCSAELRPLRGLLPRCPIFLVGSVDDDLQSIIGKDCCRAFASSHGARIQTRSSWLSGSPSSPWDGRLEDGVRGGGSTHAFFRAMNRLSCAHHPQCWHETRHRKAGSSFQIGVSRGLRIASNGRLAATLARQRNLNETIP